MRSLSILMSALLAAAALTACGGGGGGSTADGGDAIIESRAVITASNAEQIVLDALTGMRTGSSQNSTANSAGAAAKAATSLAVNELARSVAAFAMPIDQTLPGSCGGTMTMGGSASLDSINMTVNHFDFCEGGMTYSGTQSISGSPTAFSVTTTGATIKSSTMHVTWKGRMDIVSSGGGSPMTSTATMNFDLIDHINGRTGRYSDFVVNSTITPPSVEQTVSGTYYDSVNGYVTMSTQEPLYYPSMQPSEDSIYPARGVVLCEGANGTRALGTFYEDFTHRIEADTDGNGTPDFDSGRKNTAETNTGGTNTGGTDTGGTDTGGTDTGGTDTGGTDTGGTDTGGTDTGGTDTGGTDTGGDDEACVPTYGFTIMSSFDSEYGGAQLRVCSPCDGSPIHWDMATMDGGCDDGTGGGTGGIDLGSDSLMCQEFSGISGYCSSIQACMTETGGFYQVNGGTRFDFNWDTIQAAAESAVSYACQ